MNEEAVHHGFQQPFQYPHNVREVWGVGHSEQDVDNVYGMDCVIQSFYGDPVAQLQQDVNCVYSRSYTEQTFCQVLEAQHVGAPGVPSRRTSDKGSAINFEHGAILCETPTIFIRNLSFDCTSHDLFNLLLRVELPIHYTLLRTRTGAFNGCALATYRSGRQATDVIAWLNGTKHMCKTLQVRLAKEKAAIMEASSCPLIVGQEMWDNLRSRQDKK